MSATFGVRGTYALEIWNGKTWFRTSLRTSELGYIMNIALAIEEKGRSVRVVSL